MKKFNLKEVKEDNIITRDGKKARIICTDRKATGNRYTIVALVTNEDGFEDIYRYTKDGKFSDSGTESTLDLFLLGSFDLEKAIKEGCRTRKGRKAEIITNYRTGSSNHPVAAIIHYEDRDIIESFTTEGYYFSNNVETDYDLLNL